MPFRNIFKIGSTWAMVYSSRNIKPASLSISNCREISNIRRIISQNLNGVVLPCTCLCPIHWSQVLSWVWRCSWSSAERLSPWSSLGISVCAAGEYREIVGGVKQSWSRTLHKNECQFEKFFSHVSLYNTKGRHLGTHKVHVVKVVMVIIDYNKSDSCPMSLAGCSFIFSRTDTYRYRKSTSIIET